MLRAAGQILLINVILAVELFTYLDICSAHQRLDLQLNIFSGTQRACVQVVEFAELIGVVVVLPSCVDIEEGLVVAILVEKLANSRLKAQLLLAAGSTRDMLPDVLGREQRDDGGHVVRAAHEHRREQRLAEGGLKREAAHLAAEQGDLAFCVDGVEKEELLESLKDGVVVGLLHVVEVEHIVDVHVF